MELCRDCCDPGEVELRERRRSSSKSLSRKFGMRRTGKEVSVKI
jgi:hypothetical protein